MPTLSIRAGREIKNHISKNSIVPIITKHHIIVFMFYNNAPTRLGQHTAVFELVLIMGSIYSLYVNFYIHSFLEKPFTGRRLHNWNRYIWNESKPVQNVFREHIKLFNTHKKEAQPQHFWEIIYLFFCICLLTIL
jgi:hypothetical protein